MAKTQGEPRTEPGKRDHIGRDEMNLAEFPIALLTHRANLQKLTIHKERQITLPDGRTLQQEWIVTGTPEYGLPQPCDEDILLGLLKISSDHGFVSPKVEFSQRALLSLIRWSSQAWSHERLAQALARLKTTSILAKNSFWDKQRRQYQTLHFGIIDSYQLVDRYNWQRDNTLNWARFSDEFFSSIQGGYIKPLALDIYFSLNSSVSKRLFRYLDKKRYRKECYEINIAQLAAVHVGMSLTKCRYPSWIKQKLDPAHRELQECGFLKSVTYQHDREGHWKACYTFGEARLAPEQPLLPGIIDPNLKMVQELSERGVTEKVARELVEMHPRDVIEKQIDIFDYLRENDARSLRNPAAFLVHSIRDQWSLHPPGYVPRAERELRVCVVHEKQREEEAEARQKQQDQEALEQLKADLGEELLNELRAEALVRVRERLGRILQIQEKSPLVHVEFNDLLRQRYMSTAPTNEPVPA